MTRIDDTPYLRGWARYYYTQNVQVFGFFWLVNRAVLLSLKIVAFFKRLVLSNPDPYKTDRFLKPVRYSTQKSENLNVWSIYRINFTQS